MVFRPVSGLWAAEGLTRFYYGNENNIPLPADYNGDGAVEAALFLEAGGRWAIRDLSLVYFGTEGDLPVPADYRGDGAAETAIFRPASGLWAVRGLTRFYFGRDEDIPVPGDYDGNGTYDPGIFRPASGLWAIRGITRIYFGVFSDCPLPAGDDFLKYTEITSLGDNKQGYDVLSAHLANILPRHPDCVLHTGDMVGSGENYEDWANFTGIMEPVADILYPSPGNHEEELGGTFYNYYSVFSHLYSDAESLYYSFDLNDIHIISLDSNYFTQKQGNWLINDLEENQDARWKFVLCHHPPFSSGAHGCWEWGRTFLVPHLEEYNITMVFSGHSHSYERTYPIREEQIDETGIVYVVTGGAGAPLYQIGSNWWSAYTESTYHYVEIIIQGRNLQLKTFDLDNQEIDSYSLIKP